MTGAHLCRQITARRRSRGLWLETVTYDVVGGLGTLVDAYQHPDGPVGHGPCLAIGYGALLVTFTTPFGDVEAREPRGTCFAPVPAAVQAYQHLRLRKVRAVWERQISSQRALDSGCAEQWKNMIMVERDRPAATAAPLDPLGEQRVCIYRDVAPDSGGGDPELTAAGPSSRRDIATLVQRLHAGAPTCSAAVHTYAVLGEMQADVYLALDGCRGRALWDSGSGMLDPSGLRLLNRLVARTR
ncbi:hypothetical protein [Motilibacter peucedani]|uniref:hypothetical protein n=1 Tax=Motilibacter peucedani TaxID=598650 RepID=UPI0011C4587C|nr:hypothetical protein [Motilibacter peucedani]